MRMCSIASGSSGNCIYVGNDQGHLLVDAGISRKRIEEGLHSIGIKGEDVDGIFITHEHSDHIKGLGVFCRKYRVPIYATKGTIEGIKRNKGLGIMPEGLYREVEIDEICSLGEITVKPFAISHDARQPCGFRIHGGSHVVAVATDLGEYNDYIVENLKNLDGIFLEANHDVHMLEVGPYPYHLKKRVMSNQGHLSNELSGRLLCDILHDGLQFVMLGHLSNENNFAELAYETVKLEVTMGNNRYKGEDLRMFVAKRDSISNLVVVRNNK